MMVSEVGMKFRLFLGVLCASAAFACGDDDGPADSGLSDTGVDSAVDSAVDTAVDAVVTSATTDLRKHGFIK